MHCPPMRYVLCVMQNLGASPPPELGNNKNPCIIEIMHYYVMRYYLFNCICGLLVLKKRHCVNIYLTSRTVLTRVAMGKTSDNIIITTEGRQSLW